MRKIFELPPGDYKLIEPDALTRVCEKAAILDELIDQAATYCAVRASNGLHAVDYVAAPAQLAYLVVTKCDGFWYGDGGEICKLAWAEAEARLRNGECWDLLIGGGE